MKQSRLLLGSVAALSMVAIGSVAINASAANEELPTETQTNVTMPAPGGFMRHQSGEMNGKPFTKAFKAGFGMGRHGGLGFKWMETKNPEAHAALLAGDYEAFLSATEDAGKIETLTEEHFERMAAHAQKAEAIEDAIENEDYEAFVEASTPSEEEFAEIVEHHKKQQAIREAIENEDYEAFQEAVSGTPMETMTEAQFQRLLEKKQWTTQVQPQ